MVSWPLLFEFWACVECDLHEMYGIDMEDTALLEHRSWRWLNMRIWSLVATADTRIRRALSQYTIEHEGE